MMDRFESKAAMFERGDGKRGGIRRSFTSISWFGRKSKKSDAMTSSDVPRPSAERSVSMERKRLLNKISSSKGGKQCGDSDDRASNEQLLQSSFGPSESNHESLKKPCASIVASSDRTSCATDTEPSCTPAAKTAAGGATATSAPPDDLTDQRRVTTEHDTRPECKLDPAVAGSVYIQTADSCQDIVTNRKDSCKKTTSNPELRHGKNPDSPDNDRREKTGVGIGQESDWVGETDRGCGGETDSLWFNRSTCSLDSVIEVRPTHRVGDVNRDNDTSAGITDVGRVDVNVMMSPLDRADVLSMRQNNARQNTRCRLARSEWNSRRASFGGMASVSRDLSCSDDLTHIQCPLVSSTASTDYDDVYGLSKPCDLHLRLRDKWPHRQESLKTRLQMLNGFYAGSRGDMRVGNCRQVDDRCNGLRASTLADRVPSGKPTSIQQTEATSSMITSSELTSVKQTSAEPPSYNARKMAAEQLTVALLVWLLWMLQIFSSSSFPILASLLLLSVDRFTRRAISFDDSDSISSGDISDTINEISTDENLSNLTGGSSLSGTGSDQTNPYASLKRAPNGHPLSQQGNLTSRSLPAARGILPPKSTNTAIGRNVGGSKDRLDNILGENWKKYCISAEDPGRPSLQGPSPFERGSLDRASLPVSAKDRSDVKGLAYPGSLPGAVFIKKKSNQSNQATITDLRSRSLRNSSGVAVEDPHLGESVSDSEATKLSDHRGKKDSECNTDHSVAMFQSKGGRGQRSAGSLTSSFGFHRPLSSASNASTKSGGSGKMTEAEAIKGERLSNYSKGTPMSMGKMVGGGQSAYSRGGHESMSDSGGSLERKKGVLMSARGQSLGPGSGGSTLSSPDGDYRASTLGRRKTSESNLKDRLFGSRSSLNKLNTSDPHVQPGMASSMIISNPHATFSKLERPSSRNSDSPYANVSVGAANSYLSSDYIPSRPMSGISSPTTGSPWIKPSSNVIANGMRCALSETESMESLNSIQAQIQQARALGQRASDAMRASNQPALHRSDSFKSCKSEQVGPTCHMEAALPRTNSFNQLNGGGAGASPSSPTPSHGSSRFTFPLSSLGSKSSSSPYANVYLPLTKLSASKDDLRGSQLSLVSSSSSVYSTAEEKQNHEIRKLRRELEGAHDKVNTLSSQLTTNAHVVSAFEQSLTNMTNRLQQLTLTAESKDSELNELRATIEALKKHSGIIGELPVEMRRQSSNSGGLPSEVNGMSRHMSTDSVSSLNSQSSACSANSQQSASDKKKQAKKKNWLRSSFSKAFSSNNSTGLPTAPATKSKGKKCKNGSMSDVEADTASLRGDASVPSSPLVGPHALSMPTTPVKTSLSSGTISGGSGDETVLDLQQQLHEKDMKLTDIRLEALSSAAQLEQLRENMNKMKSEMSSLKADNDRLQTMVGSKGYVPPSHTALEPRENRLSLGDPSSLDLMLSGDQIDRDGRRITVSVALSSNSETCKLNEVKVDEVFIGAISVSGKTKWEMLDNIVRKVFKDYVMRVDPSSNMGLTGDSVHCYSVADIKRFRDEASPEFLPCGYLVAEHTNIAITLTGITQSSVDLMAFETLIPKSIMQRYVSLLNEHRRIILCGPSGTGKTYLAQRLAEYLVIMAGKEPTAGAIATFNVDHKSSKELRQYLSNIADQCEHSAVDLPNVIILDNLHHVSSLGEVFNGFLNVKYKECPYIIGTMNQATCSSTNLQLHHNFRWVLCANHMEPVKGFLGRYLRRKAIHEEVGSGSMKRKELAKIVDWIPKVWQHLNKFLETHSSSDVTIGPRLFLSCPMDVSGSQVWFTDLWNYSIVPYLLEAVREGIQLYGRRAPWEDPADWVIDTYPWTPSPRSSGSGGQQGEPHDWPSLLHLRPEDVGYDTQGAAQNPGSSTTTATTGKTGSVIQQSDAEGDPLLNMLMRLQEAASYSSPQSQDSDNTSVDSHSSGVHEFNGSHSQGSSGHSSREGSAGVESTI